MHTFHDASLPAKGGFVTERSALNAHTEILLKGYDIPSAGAAKDIMRLAKPGGAVVAGGIQGIVIVNPGPNAIKNTGPPG